MRIAFRPRYDVACIPAELPPGHPNAAAGRAVMAWWQKRFGPATQRDADFEDWVENASQLQAALRLPAQVRVLRHAGGKTAAPDDTIADILIGSLLRGDPLLTGPHAPLWPNREAEALANRYACTAAFRAQAGRAFELTWSGDREEGDPLTPGLNETVIAMVERGHRDLAVKIVAQAKYAAPVRLEFADTSREAIADALVEALDYSVVHLAGVPDAFLVQEWLPDLADEYRIVMIDGLPVAGAGCIEAHTPLDNQGVAFNPVVEGRRGSGELRSDPELVSRYHAAAIAAAESLRAEARGVPVDMCLDYGCRGDGSIVLIEANPLMNYGLYAIDFGVVLAAIHDAIERRLDGSPERGTPGM